MQCSGSRDSQAGNSQRKKDSRMRMRENGEQQILQCSERVQRTGPSLPGP